MKRKQIKKQAINRIININVKLKDIENNKPFNESKYITLLDRKVINQMIIIQNK